MSITSTSEKRTELNICSISHNIYRQLEDSNNLKPEVIYIHSDSQEQIIAKKISIPTSAWEETLDENNTPYYRAYASCSGVTADKNEQSILVTPNINATNFVASDYNGVLCVDQSENQLEFISSIKPTVTLRFYIEIKQVKLITV